MCVWEEERAQGPRCEVNGPQCFTFQTVRHSDLWEGQNPPSSSVIDLKSGSTRTTVARPSVLGVLRLVVYPSMTSPTATEDARRHSFPGHQAGVDSGGWASCPGGMLCPCLSKAQTASSSNHCTWTRFPTACFLGIGPYTPNFRTCSRSFSRPSCTSCGSVISPTDVSVDISTVTSCVHQRGQHHCLRQHMYNLIISLWRCQPPYANSAFSMSMSKGSDISKLILPRRFLQREVPGNRDFLILNCSGAGR